MLKLHAYWIAMALAGTSPLLHAQETKLAALSWLSGCWSAEADEPGSVEHWLPLAGGTMLGVGRTVKNGKTVAHEFMQIRADAQGQIVYIAKPDRKPEATFTMTTGAADAVTFENLQHEFPQRVMYRLLAGDRLAARIEGMRDGVLRGIDYPMRRVSCDK